MRDLSFVHRFHTPADPDGSVIALLHGTGGDEADLMPLAARINPRATLLGLRGRSNRRGEINRWFRRFDAMTYDQEDIRAEAEAFAGFVKGEVSGYGLDPAGMTCLGYSNGANLLGVAHQRHPGTVRRAILLRGIQVLENPPAADMAGARVLILTGVRDPYGHMAPALEKALREGGAAVTARRLNAGHVLSSEDPEVTRGRMA